MKLPGRVLMLLALIVPCAASAQAAITAESILGIWIADEGEFVAGPSGCPVERHRLLVFHSNKQLEMTSLDDAEIAGCEPIRRPAPQRNTEKGTPGQKPIDLAYAVGQAVCSLGEKKGQLYLVAGSRRCCFQAYHMGGKLILDQIKIPGILNLKLPGDICSSNTYTLFVPTGSEPKRNAP